MLGVSTPLDSRGVDGQLHLLTLAIMDGRFHDSFVPVEIVRKDLKSAQFL